MIVLLLILALSALALAVYSLHVHTQLKRTVLERLHAIETKQAELSASQDRMAADWSSIFGNVQRAWDKHIENVADKVAVQLSFTNNSNKRR